MDKSRSSTARINTLKKKMKMYNRYRYHRNPNLELYQFVNKPFGTKRKWCWCGKKQQDMPCRCVGRIDASEELKDQLKDDTSRLIV